MKYKFLTSCLLSCCASICSYGALAYDLEITSTSDITGNGPFSNVGILTGGNYNLSALDNVLDSGALLYVNAPLSENTCFIADLAFDGNMDVSLNLDSNVKLKLMDEYLAIQTNPDEIMRLRSLSPQNRLIIIEGDSPSGIYNYEWVSCADGTGKCLKRVNSNAYNQSRQEEQHRIMVATQGVQNNPQMLLQPMSVINQKELTMMYDFSDEFFMSVAPEYYFSKNFNGLGLKLNSGVGVLGKLSVGFSAYAYRSDFENSVSGFKSNIYGGNVRLNYNMYEQLFLRGVGGVSFASIDCDSVVDGDEFTNNPNAFGVYGGMDFGAKFNFESGMFLSPFVGVNFVRESVVDVNQSDLFLRVGNDIGFKYFMDGVSYNYFLRTGVNSDGYLDADLGIGVWTVSDKIGGSVSVGVMDTDFGWSGKISGNIRFAF
ncbi:MAG: autotransporter domain-containing protein [Proteobacteria bacterium]|nr:autotransporter domain-containing protein [Candidatus Enterousia onthequi]